MRKNNFRKNLHLQLDSTPLLNGLAELQNSLEKDYFSQVNIRNCKTEGSNWNLIIEMECNFDLVEILFYLEKGRWGKSPFLAATSANTSPLKRALTKFREINELEVDVEEFSIFLKDSSIIIKKIYDHSIGEQFGAILHTIAQHYVYFTKKLTATPYEIYIPVFEENVLDANGLLTNANGTKSGPKDYLDYWGLYFDTEDDAVIYDLGNKSIISGDLFMLNH